MCRHRGRCRWRCAGRRLWHAGHCEGGPSIKIRCCWFQDVSSKANPNDKQNEKKISVAKFSTKRMWLAKVRPDDQLNISPEAAEKVWYGFHPPNGWKKLEKNMWFHNCFITVWYIFSLYNTSWPRLVWVFLFAMLQRHMGHFQLRILKRKSHLGSFTRWIRGRPTTPRAMVWSIWDR